MRPTLSEKSLLPVSTAFLLLATFLLYCKVSGFDFINFDDPYLLLDNPNVYWGLSLNNLKWAFTATDRFQWAPLTWITHMADFQLYGRNPSGHHITNLLFHLANTGALLLFLYRATTKYWQSFLVAVLFAVHPLHVEPVAWVAARKDLVSAFFFLLTLHAYWKYATRPTLPSYLATLALYLLSLMAKPMYVTLPLVLALMDYWPLERLGSGAEAPVDAPSLRGNKNLLLFLEKVPFLVASVIFCFVAYLTQSRAGAVEPFHLSLLTTRLSNVILAYLGYLQNTVWPWKLAVIYPYLEIIPLAKAVLAALLLAIITLVVLKNRRIRYLVFGWFWFLTILLPVIGIIRIGPVYMADRFGYMAIAGLFVLLVWGAGDTLKTLWRRPRLAAVYAISAAVITLLGIRSFGYLDCWKNSIALYTQTLRVTENNYVANGNMGAAYNEQGKYDQALGYFLESVRIEPRYDVGYAEIGRIYLRKRDCRQALPYFYQALLIRPENQSARFGLETCLRLGGFPAGAQ